MQQPEVQEHRGEQPVVLAGRDAVHRSALVVRGPAEDAAPQVQRRLGTEQSTETLPAQRVRPLHGGEREQRDDHVDRDQRDRDVPVLPGPSAAERGTHRSLGTPALAYALRALVTDRRLGHAVGADRPVTARTADVGLPARMPVAHRYRADGLLGHG